MFKSIKLLVLGFAGIAGTIGGIVLTSSSKKETKPEIIEPIKHFNSNKKRKYSTQEFEGEIRNSKECEIYWVEGVSFDGNENSLSFDKLKGRYSSKAEFLEKAPIPKEEEIRNNYPFDSVCEEHNKGYYYFWEDSSQSGGWMRQPRNKLEDNIKEE